VPGRLVAIGRRNVAVQTSEVPEFKGRIHEVGGRCKSLAVAAKNNISTASPPLKLFYALKLCFYAFFFIIYRAYRGFFVIIPAVFKEVQGKLTAGLIEAENELNADVDPSTGKLRTRSATLISIGASIVTLIYTIKTVGKGFLMGIGKFIGLFGKKQDPEIQPNA